MLQLKDKTRVELDTETFYCNATSGTEIDTGTFTLDASNQISLNGSVFFGNANQTYFNDITNLNTIGFNEDTILYINGDNQVDKLVLSTFPQYSSNVLTLEKTVFNHGDNSLIQDLNTIKEEGDYSNKLVQIDNAGHLNTMPKSAYVSASTYNTGITSINNSITTINNKLTTITNAGALTTTKTAFDNSSFYPVNVLLDTTKTHHVQIDIMVHGNANISATWRGMIVFTAGVGSIQNPQLTTHFGDLTGIYSVFMDELNTSLLMYFNGESNTGSLCAVVHDTSF